MAQDLPQGNGRVGRVAPGRPDSELALGGLILRDREVGIRGLGRPGFVCGGSGRVVIALGWTV